MPTEYRISAGRNLYYLSVNDGICITASAEIDWTINASAKFVFNYFTRKGWPCVPVEQILGQETTNFEFHGDNYLLTWQDKRLVSILRNDESIAWAQLPEPLKGLL